jgi:hypothetical protein
MCLSTVWPKKKQKEWLKKQKSPLIVYGLAKQMRGKYWPIMFKARPYKSGVNEIKVQRVLTYTQDFTTKYRPYYHRFVAMAGAKSWQDYSDEVVLEWRVSKKDITDIGYQNLRCHKRTVIIARKLTLLGEVKKRKKAV